MHPPAMRVRLWRSGPLEADAGEVEPTVETGTDRHRHEAPIPVPPADAARILDARPTSWLTSFLQLAVVWAVPDRQASSPHWFRLGTFGSDGDDGQRCATFIWRPHLDGDLFGTFRGRFVVRDAPGGGSTLVLEGTAEGGVPDVNDRVLAALVESLVSALGAGQDASG
jgi:hypothetical protein